MMTVLSVAAGVLVGLLLFAAIVVFWLKRKLKKVADSLGALADALGGGVPPFRITLQPEPDHDWKAAASVTSVTDALRALGYVE